MSKYVIFMVGFILGTVIMIIAIKKGREIMKSISNKTQRQFCATCKASNSDGFFPIESGGNFKVKSYKTVSEQLNRHSVTLRPNFKWD